MTRMNSNYCEHSLLIFISTIAILLGSTSAANGFQRDKKFDLTGTVTDADGNAVSSARIVLVHKSWPNNRFRMKTYASKTNEEGKFIFRKQYYSNQPSEFLVTVVANGMAMTSDYIENQSGDHLDPLKFELEKAIDKTFVFNEGGKPLSKTRVFAKSRTSKSGDEHFIYPISASKLTLQTDANGKVKMNIFQPGDRVVIGMHRKGGTKEINLTIDSEAEQSIGGSNPSSASDSSIAAIVKDKDGNPITNAKILISHKTWPNRRFRMDNYAGTTTDKGTYELPGVYSSDGRNGILISVLADGYVMESQYVSTDGEELEPFEFQLDTANSKKIRFEDSKGRPMKNARVLPVNRKDKGGNEHLVYPASAGKFSLKTDSDGTIEIGLFDDNDEVEFMVNSQGQMERTKVTIGDSDTQTVTVKKKLTP